MRERVIIGVITRRKGSSFTEPLFFVDCSEKDVNWGCSFISSPKKIFGSRRNEYSVLRRPAAGDGFKRFIHGRTSSLIEEEAFGRRHSSKYAKKSYFLTQAVNLLSKGRRPAFSRIHNRFGIGFPRPSNIRRKR